MNRNMLKIGMSMLLFVSLIVCLQIESDFLIGMLGVYAVILYMISDKGIRSFVVTNMLFGIGFFAYLFVVFHVDFSFQTKELNIFFNRLSLILILIPLYLWSLSTKRPFILYWKKPEWNEYIYFPFIWLGFHKVKVKYFLCIAIAINFFSFIPFMFQNGWSYIEGVLLLGIVFAITNAILEELIWRGVLLSRFSEQFGEKWAVILTSLGFGLQHYSLGFSWGVCLAFALGGLFYGGVTIKSKSIVPAIIWHILMNILMVFSGLIFI